MATMKRMGILLAALLLGALAFAGEFSIIHFNDVYEIQPVKKGKYGGAARVATLIKELGGQENLILFSGDAFSPSIMSSVFKGKQMVDVFNRLGLDYATFGNHEFDFGPEVAAQRVKESKFTWISTNLVDKRTGEGYVGAVRWALVDWNGVKVGLLGLIDNWLDLTSPGPNAQYLDFVQVGREYARMLKAKGAEVVIALTHMDMANDEKLAASVPEIDLILGGHDHAPMWKVVNGTLIWKTGANWVWLGHLKVYTIPGLKPVVIPTEYVVDSKIPEDPEMAKVVAKYAAALDKAMNEVIGETKVPLDARRKVVRRQESNLGNLITDAMREYAKTECAIQNGGGIRTDRIYGPGPITKKDIFSILPFGNVVISIKIDGKTLKAALENGVSQWERTKGRFPQVSGIKYVFDPKRKPGNRVLEVYVNGKPLDPNKTYTCAINDYIGRGGDGYVMFKNAPRIFDERNGKLLAQVVVDYIKAHSPVAPKVEGRIVIVGQ